MRTAMIHVLLGLATILAIPGLIYPVQSPSLQQPVAQETPDAPANNSISLSGADPTPTFDVSGFIEVPYNSQLNFTGGAITIEAWVNRANASRNETIFGNGWQESYWFGFSPTGKLRFTPDGFAHHADSLATIPANKWTHVAIVFNNGIYTFYVNSALDRMVTQAGGSLVAAPNGSTMYIGFDRNDTFDPNYYAGYVDEIRIWRAARSSQQIQDGLFTYVGGAAANLRAEWRLNGDALDSTGANNGILHGGGAIFVNDGALPKDIRIPRVTSTPSLSGACPPSEYANALSVSVQGSLAYLQHTDDDLWVCFPDLGGSNEVANVYLDPQYTRTDPSQPEHIRLSVNSTGAKSAAVGNAAGGYVITTTLNTQWDADYAITGEFFVHSAEFRISSESAGRLGPHHRPGPEQDAHGAGPAGDQLVAGPGRLQPALHLEQRHPGRHRPQPHLQRQSPVRPEEHDLPGEPGGRRERAVDRQRPGRQRGPGGRRAEQLFWEFQHLHQRQLPEPPPGAGLPAAGHGVRLRHPGAGGTAVDERTIDFGPIGAGTHSGSIFHLRDAAPYLLDTTNGPIYLIIAPQAVFDSQALEDFRTYKLTLGFTTETKSIESIDASMPGANRQDRIRAYERNRKDAYGSRLKYVLLVGSQSTIPSIKVHTGITGKAGMDCASLLSGDLSFRYSDWIYVDLYSNFDTNGNGCYADGIWSKPDGPGAWLRPGHRHRLREFGDDWAHPLRRPQYDPQRTGQYLELRAPVQALQEPDADRHVEPGPGRLPPKRRRLRQLG